MRAIAAPLLVMALATFSPALAAESPADIATAISREVMSPYCPGLTLHDCPSQEAVELRRRIENWARAGAGEDRIRERLISEFGDQIRAAPPAEGTGLLAWLLPLLAVPAGGAAAWFTLRRWARARPASATTPAGTQSDVTPEQRARLERELRAYREPT